MPAPIITRAYEAKLDVADGERSVVAKINTGAVDRYRTVIDPAGIDLAAYRSNPVVLWNHGTGHDGKPVAKAAWVRYVKAEGCLIAKAVFLDDEFSDGIFQLYQSGTLRAFSVAINPDPNGSGPPTADEIRKRPELVDCYRVYRKSELCEFSAVAVPGNAEALALAVSRGLWLPEDMRAMVAADGEELSELPSADSAGQSTPELPPLNARRTLAQGVVAGLDRLRRAVPAEVDRATRDRLDLLRGRV